MFWSCEFIRGCAQGEWKSRSRQSVSVRISPSQYDLLLSRGCVSPGSIVRIFCEPLDETTDKCHVRQLLRADVCVAGQAAFKKLALDMELALAAERQSAARKDAQQPPQMSDRDPQNGTAKQKEVAAHKGLPLSGNVPTPAATGPTQVTDLAEMPSEQPAAQAEPAERDAQQGPEQTVDKQDNSSDIKCVDAEDDQDSYDMLSAKETITGTSLLDSASDTSAASSASDREAHLRPADEQAQYIRTPSRDTASPPLCAQTGASRNLSVGSEHAGLGRSLSASSSKDENESQAQEQGAGVSAVVGVEQDEDAVVFLANTPDRAPPHAARDDTGATESSAFSGARPTGDSLAELLSSGLQQPPMQGAFGGSPATLYSMPPPLDGDELSGTPPWKLNLGGESAPAAPPSSMADSFTGLWGTSHSAGSQPLAGLLGGLRHSALSNPLVAPLAIPRGASQEDLPAVAPTGNNKPLSTVRRNGLFSPGGTRPAAAPPGFSPPSAGSPPAFWTASKGGPQSPSSPRRASGTLDEDSMRADLEALLDAQSEEASDGDSNSSPGDDSPAAVAATWEGLAQATAEAGLSSPTPQPSVKQLLLQQHQEEQAALAATKAEQERIEAEHAAAEAAAQAKAEQEAAAAAAQRRELLRVLGASWAVMPEGDADDASSSTCDDATNDQEKEDPAMGVKGGNTPAEGGEDDEGGVVESKAQSSVAAAAPQDDWEGEEAMPRYSSNAQVHASPASSIATPATGPEATPLYPSSEAELNRPGSFQLDHAASSGFGAQFALGGGSTWDRTPTEQAAAAATTSGSNPAAMLLGSSGFQAATSGGMLPSSVMDVPFDGMSAPLSHSLAFNSQHSVSAVGGMPHSGPPPPGAMMGMPPMQFSPQVLAAMQMQMTMQMQQYAAGSVLGGGVPPPFNPHTMGGLHGYPMGGGPPGGDVQGGNVGGAPPSPTHAEARDMYAALHAYERQLMEQQAQLDAAKPQEQPNPRQNAFHSKGRLPSPGGGIARENLQAALAEYDTLRAPKNKKMSNKALRQRSKILAAAVHGRDKGLLGGGDDGDSMDSEEATMRRLLKKWEHRTAEQAAAALAGEGSREGTVASEGEVVWSTTSSMPSASSSEYEEDIVFARKPTGAQGGVGTMASLGGGDGIKATADDGTRSLSETDGARRSSRGSRSDAERASPSQWTSGSSIEDVVFVSRDSALKCDLAPLNTASHESEHSAPLSSIEDSPASTALSDTGYVPTADATATEESKAAADASLVGGGQTAKGGSEGSRTPVAKAKKNKKGKKSKKKAKQAAAAAPIDQLPSEKGLAAVGGTRCEGSKKQQAASDAAASLPLPSTSAERRIHADSAKAVPAEAFAPGGAGDCTTPPPAAAEQVDDAEGGTPEGGSKKRARNKEYWKRRKALAKAAKGGKGPSTGESK